MQHDAVASRPNVSCHHKMGEPSNQQPIFQTSPGFEVHLDDNLFVRLKDGSTFYLEAGQVLRRVAEYIAIEGIPPGVHIEEQLLPALQGEPNLIVDITRKMVWEDVMAIASRQFWKTPISMTGATLWESAEIYHQPVRPIVH